MVTTISDLLGTVIDSAVHGEPDEGAADAAIAAAGQLGRALGHLIDATDRTSAATRRDLVVGELARACRAAAAQWPTTSGRAVDVAAATADRSAGCRSRSTRPEVGARVGGVVRGASTRRNGHQVRSLFQGPALLRVTRLSDVMGQLQILDRPSVEAHASSTASCQSADSMLPRVRPISPLIWCTR